MCNFVAKYNPKTAPMTNEEVERLCKKKEQELLNSSFSKFVIKETECSSVSIGDYTPDFPLRVEAEYRTFLEELWKEVAPEELKKVPFVFEEQKLRELMTERDREDVKYAYKDAKERTLWEIITKTNHEDVALYKNLLMKYTCDLMYVMRHDFLEEVTGHHIKNKAFEED